MFVKIEQIPAIDIQYTPRMFIRNIVRIIRRRSSNLVTCGCHVKMANSLTVTEHFAPFSPESNKNCATKIPVINVINSEFAPEIESGARQISYLPTVNCRHRNI